MNWAERNYPQFFPTNEPTQTAAPYLFRYYPATQNYLGIAGDVVAVLGPMSGGQVVQVGTMGQFRCLVVPLECDPLKPQQVLALGTLSVAIGAAGEVMAWGSLQYFPTDESASIQGSTTGKRVVGLSARQVASGSSPQRFLALRTDGSVVGWGDQLGGWLGSGSPFGPSKVTRQVAWPRAVKQVSFITGYPTALLDDGSVWITGGKIFTGLGAQQGAEPVTGLKDVLMLANGEGGTLAHAILRDGSVVRLNISLSADLSSITSRPVAVQGATDIISVACGIRHCLALRRDGAVLAWGQGPLGNGGNWQTRSDTAVQVVDLPSAAGVAVMTVGKGRDMAVAWTLDGRLYRWGDMDLDTVARADRPVLEVEPKGVIEGSCRDHCVLRTSDGTVWGFGRGDLRPLGDLPMTNWQSNPIRLPGVPLLPP